MVLNKKDSTCMFVHFYNSSFTVFDKKPNSSKRGKRGREQLSTVCIYTGVATVKARHISGNVPQQEHTIQSHPHGSKVVLFYFSDLGFFSVFVALNLVTPHKENLQRLKFKYGTCPTLTGRSEVSTPVQAK